MIRYVSLWIKAQEVLWLATYKAQFLQMAEAVQAIQDKLEIYEKYENIREREFRELEREVYKLKQL